MKPHLKLPFRSEAIKSGSIRIIDADNNEVAVFNYASDAEFFCDIANMTMQFNAPESDKISKGHLFNFQTLVRAFENHDVALMNCFNKKHQEYVTVICAVVEDDKTYTFTPFAQMFNENPFEILIPPTHHESTVSKT